MASKKIKGITIEIGGNVQPLNKALEGVNKKSRDLQGELRQVDRLLKLDPKNTELVAQKQQLLGEAVGNTKDKLNTLKEAQKQVEEQFRRGEIGEEQYRALQREVIKTEQDLKSLEKQLKDVNNKWKDAGKAVGDFGKKTTEVGKSLTKGLTAPILGVSAASQVAWKEVDDALDTIVVKTGAAGEAMDGLEQSFKNVVSTLPTDMQTVGDAIGEMNTQFGLTGPALEEATAKAIKFSEINGQDVSKTAIDARQAIEAFQLQTEDLGMVLDAVTKTAQDTGQSTDVLFDRVTKGAPQLKAMNLNFAQGVKLMGKFEQEGIDSSKALSYMARAQVVFAKEGKTLEQGMADIIRQIQGATSETEALTIASAAFGAKGATFMLDALQRGALDLKGFEDAATSAAGTVESTFEGTLNPADKMKVAFNNLKLVGADLGGTIQETLAPMIEKLVGWLQRAVDWFGSLTDGQKKTIVIVGGLVAAIGPLLMVIGSIATGISALLPLLGAAAGAIGAISAPVLLVVAGIAALIAIIILVIKYWDEIVAAFKAGWEWLSGVFQRWWEDFSGFWIGLWDGIKSTLTESWETMKRIFTAAVLTIVTFAREKFNSIMEFFGGIRDKFVSIFTTIKEKVLGIWSGIVDGIKGFINKIIGAINGMIGGMNKLKWDVPDWVPLIGGKTWGINIPLIPKLHTGTDYFTPPNGMREGLALLERGERVIPKNQATSSEVKHSGTITVRGVTDEGQLVAIKNMLIEDLLVGVRM